jgi:hypothetical protein
MKRYAMCVRMFPEARFTFQAENDEEAQNYGLKWAMYQGLNWRLDMVVRPAHQNELTMQIHNEYLIK